MADVENMPAGASRTAVIHDYFAIRGGGERLALTLAKDLKADLVYGFREDMSYPIEAFNAPIDLGLPQFWRRAGIRAAALAWRFSAVQTLMRRYRVRIFSGAFAPFATPSKSDDAGTNIYYCHTPPRFLFDQRQHFLGAVPGWLHAPVQIALKVFEHRYRRAVSRMDVIVANSENTRSRIRRYLGLESVVVYPPIDTDRFRWLGQADYYLSTARLSPLKRVDRIIDAFARLPAKRLIVCSGGEDLKRLRRKAAGAPNIEFRGWVSEDELRELVGNAIATLYVPRDEDFGMSPVESMAAGKPVIGVAEGGLLETIVPGKTGILLPPDFTDDQLVEAVEALTPQRALDMRAACEQHAQAFSLSTFLGSMRQVIDRALRESAHKA